MYTELYRLLWCFDPNYNISVYKAIEVRITTTGGNNEGERRANETLQILPYICQTFHSLLSRNRSFIVFYSAKTGVILPSRRNRKIRGLRRPLIPNIWPKGPGYICFQWPHSSDNWGSVQAFRFGCHSLGQIYLMMSPYLFYLNVTENYKLPWEIILVKFSGKSAPISQLSNKSSTAQRCDNVGQIGDLVRRAVCQSNRGSCFHYQIILKVLSFICCGRYWNQPWNYTESISARNWRPSDFSLDLPNCNENFGACAHFLYPDGHCPYSHESYVRLN